MVLRILHCILLLLFFSSLTFAQSWYLSPVYHGRNVFSISILDRSNILAGGGNEQNDSLQEIFSSNSGGMLWEYAANDFGSHIRAMDFWDAYNGLAVGYAGKILKTGNGGDTWTRIYGPTPVSQRNFTTVLYQDDQTVFAFGGRNYTNDTVQTIIKSTNGGASWSVLRDEAGRWLKGADFIDQNTGVAVGANGTIIKTTDGGSSWNPVNSPVQSRDLNAVYFIDANTGYIAGGSYVQFDTVASFRTILKTTDGGDSWSIVMDEAGGWLTAIDFIDQNTGYIAGDGATVYKTINGGDNWSRITVPGSSWYSNFTSVKFLNEDYGAVGGYYGEVFLYSNEPLPEVITEQATVIQLTDTNATVNLRATINTHDVPVTWNFKYSTVSDFSANVGFINSPLAPASYNSSSATLMEVARNTFLPNTTYYYFVTVTSPGGTVNGDTLSFITAIPYTSLITSLATDATTSSATLAGTIVGATGPVNLFFEYGLTTQLGNEVPGSPASVSSPAITNVTAQVSGLQANSVYYYRIKAVYQSYNYYGSIQSFFSGDLYTAFETDSATNVTQTSARLNGFVDGFRRPVNLFFDFGPTTNFDTQVTAVPAFVNDTLPHAVYADVSSLQPNTFYYYRLNGQTDISHHPSVTNSFFTGDLFTVFQPTQVTNITETSAVLNGIASGFVIDAQVSFEYGPTPSLGYSVPAAPDSITDNGNFSFSAQVNNLIPGVQHYYRLKAQSVAGITYSANAIFSPNPPSSEITALAASEVNHTSAKLNGKIYHMPNPIQVSFEYGTTEFFGTEVPATPGLISDSAMHKFSSAVSGLLDNTVYYYRVKGVAGNSTYFSDTRKLYTGTPEVVNWDFQDWDQDTALLPVAWNLSSDSAIRVAGHTGAYALRLSNESYALLGTMRDGGEGNKFKGGCPFTSRPDSIIVYLNYQFAPQDSGMVLVFLHAGDSTIAQDFNFIGGTTSGNFTRMAFPIHYVSPLTPDSLLLGLISFNPTTHMPPAGLNNYLIADDFSFSPSAVLTCNGDFENWFEYDYPQFEDWHYLHTVFINPDDIPGSHSILPVINTPPDDYALEMRNVFQHGAVYSPELSTSPLGGFDGVSEAGFPVSRRYEYVNGYYQFYPDGNDTLKIDFYMYNNGALIGTAWLVQHDSVTEYNPFDLKIQYSVPGLVPDSASFYIRMRGPLGLSRAYFDKFSFDALWSTLPAIVVSNPDAEPEAGWKVYPNPASASVTIEFDDLTTTGSVYLFNLEGKQVKAADLRQGQKRIVFDLSEINAGIYLVRAVSGEKTFTKKIIITR